MTSENFGCHDVSRHRLGASARWERDGRAAASACWRGCLGHCGGCRRRLNALHDVWVLLDDGWVHFGWVGPSCSTHNPWPVDPDPRGIGRLGQARGRSRRPTMTTGPQRRQRAGDSGDGPVTEAPGRAAGTPDSLLRGPVSTALTLAGPTSVRPAGIVGILRFLSSMQRRYAFNVSTMDTGDLPGPARPLPFVPSSPPGPLACPGFPPERASQKS